MVKRLHALMNGVEVGVLEKTRSGGMAFTYDRQWLDNPARRPISLSMPLSASTYNGHEVYNYFDNLLPDNPVVRERVMAKFTVPVDHPFDILAAIGHDCVGALQLLPQKSEYQTVIEANPLSEHDVANQLRRYRENPMGMEEDDDFRISLAGVQEKTALLYREGTWSKPHGATATTHILKLPVGVIHNASGNIDLTGSCDNEWTCLEIIRHFDISTAQARVENFEEQRVLVVERFDRRWTSKRDWILRLPQEDFCQAMNLPSSKKYQADHGPGMVECLSLLQNSANAYQDKVNFIKAQILFLLLSAPDGHAKNFSVHLQPGDNFSLTPVYDVLSTFPIENKQLKHRAKLAMGWMGTTKGYRYKLQDIQLRHILFTAKKVGLLEEVETFIDNIEANTASALTLTETGAKQQNIDMAIAQPILDQTYGMAKWLQRSYRELKGTLPFN
jgi:serine/threonine-protein kinase HipA